VVSDVVFGIGLEREQRNIRRCRCKAFSTHLPILLRFSFTVGVLNVREKNLFGRKGIISDEQDRLHA
jgi:hypothetical protein